MKCTPEELAYQRAYRQRPEVKERERARARERRARPGGAETNRERVKRDRKKLGRAYISALIRGLIRISARHIPDEVIEHKREALVLRRLAKSIRATLSEIR